MLEQKVEEEFFQHEFMSGETSSGTGNAIRPEEIPGGTTLFPASAVAYFSVANWKNNPCEFH